MQREIDRLETEVFDVLVIGGGVHGACTAMEAAQRGLKTALIEKGDFSSATSHNSQKIVHGGIRYLQHLDFGRVRQSIVERRFWLRCAPHMVEPLEFWMPLRGIGTRGPAALWAGMRAHELLGWDRNKGLLAESSIPTGRIQGKSSVKKALGDIWGEKPPMAAAWTDGQMVDADRLILECVLAACEEGAVAANYLEATGLELCRDGTLAGIQAKDNQNGRELVIRASNAVVAAGPWTVPLSAERLMDQSTEAYRGLVRNMNVVIAREPLEIAVALESRQSSDAVVGHSNRLLFMTPWRNCSMVGTTHEPYEGSPDDYRVTEAEVENFLADVNGACPALNLSAKDVTYVYAGLTPSEKGEKGATRSRSSEVVDHGRQGGTVGLYSMVGVKYTTARSLAEGVVDLIAEAERKVGGRVGPSKSAITPLPGARGLQSMDSVIEEIKREGVPDPNDATDLAIAYGTRYAEALERSGSNFDRASVLEGRVRLAVQEEMATRLSDMLFRRLDWLPRGLLDSTDVERAAEIMAEELGWDQAKKIAELESFRHLATGPVGPCR